MQSTQSDLDRFRATHGISYPMGSRIAGVLKPVGYNHASGVGTANSPSAAPYPRGTAAASPSSCRSGLRRNCHRSLLHQRSTGLGSFSGRGSLWSSPSCLSLWRCRLKLGVSNTQLAIMERDRANRCLPGVQLTENSKVPAGPPCLSPATKLPGYGSGQRLAEQSTQPKIQRKVRNSCELELGVCARRRSPALCMFSPSW